MSAWRLRWSGLLPAGGLAMVRSAALALVLGGALSGCSPPAADSGLRAGLPAEVADTLQRIEQGGPFPHRRDGITFHNRERLLPAMPGGYYREYTVPTPGARDRGARRIVSGGNPPVIFYYTPDHYRSFEQIKPKP